MKTKRMIEKMDKVIEELKNKIKKYEKNKPKSEELKEKIIIIIGEITALGVTITFDKEDYKDEREVNYMDLMKLDINKVYNRYLVDVWNEVKEEAKKRGQI